ncbi:MAG: polyhydroxyalkanoic acid system family protein [Polyangiaceae bacterium]|jgi:putative polyhydroxyalkanoate system protein
MATIEVRRSHSLPRDEARKRAEELAKSLEEKLGLEWHWNGEDLVFEAPRGPAKGTKGYVRVAPAEVSVAIDLPFLLRMLKGKIESKVLEKLDRLL